MAANNAMMRFARCSSAGPCGVMIQPPLTHGGCDVVRTIQHDAFGARPATTSVVYTWPSVASHFNVLGDLYLSLDAEPSAGLLRGGSLRPREPGRG
jgi:hypothetical protein